MKHYLPLLLFMTTLTQAMTPSAQCTKLIKKHEGLRLTPYRCPGGMLSIGYGHVLERYVARISEAKANQYLFTDMNIRANDIKRLVTVPLNQNQLDALVCLVFNIGTNAFAESTLLKYINEKKPIEDIRHLWMQWHHVKHKDSAGLMARRKEESDLYCKPL